MDKSQRAHCIDGKLVHPARAQTDDELVDNNYTTIYINIEGV